MYGLRKMRGSLQDKLHYGYLIGGKMKRIAFFDTKPYDLTFFKEYGKDYRIKYFENKLNIDTASLAKGFDGVIAFVNDDISAGTIDKLYEGGVRVIALRSAGYNNVDFRAAFDKINI